MSSIDKSGTYALGTRTVKRLGYGAMQLAGPGVLGHRRTKCRAGGAPGSRGGGRESYRYQRFYGPHVTNQLIREALHPYRDDLTLVTKIGARRDDKGAAAAFSAGS